MVQLAQESPASWIAVALSVAGVFALLCGALVWVIKWLAARVDKLAERGDKLAVELKDLEKECRDDRRRLAEKLTDAEEDRERLHTENGRQQHEINGLRDEVRQLKSIPRPL